VIAGAIAPKRWRATELRGRNFQNLSLFDQIT